MKHAILQWAASRGYEVGWTGPEGTREVVAEIEGRRQAGALDAAFAHENLSFDAGQSQRTDPWKVLLIVMPRPAHVVRFLVGGHSVETLLPPTQGAAARAGHARPAAVQVIAMPGRDERVRFGGVQTPERYLFELTGGRLCLDLANTLDERKTDHPRELLRNYQDLLDWGTQAGAITGAEAALLRTHADRHPRAARSALDQARALREAIFQVFGAAAAARPVPPTPLALVDRMIGRAASMRRLKPRTDGFYWEWQEEGTDLERVVWPVAWSVGDLLTSPDLGRVRMCAGTGCAWLFIDTSKNRTRRWCDMSVCGNRAKARRHYARVSGQ